MSTQPPLLEQSVFLTVWDDAWAALSNPRMYVKWAVQPFRRSVAYVSVLLAVTSIVLTVYIALAARPHWMQLRDWIVETIPELTMSNGELAVANDETFTYSDNQNIFIRVDATDGLADAAIDSFYQVGIVVTKDGVLYRDQNGEQRLNYREQEIGNFVIDGQGVADQLRRWIILALIQLPFVLFLAFLAGHLLITGIVSFLTSLLSGFRFHYLPLWSMSLYALTPTLLVSHLAFIFVPALMPVASAVVFFTYMYMAISNYSRFLDIREKIA